ncbi:MAG: 3-phosphoshikimate 1-carboxyvinyltransferase [Vicinamibacteria bacterium]|nr:3-phosphoshikimate 1-carboxyvinyltransferase [Vicinamibacteria bacterium]
MNALLPVSPARRFQGRFTIPGDKSISHRLAIMGALAHGATRVTNFSTAADCASTLACLSRLGIPIEQQGAAVTLHGRGIEQWRAAAQPLDAGNSGSTMRMLAGPLAACAFQTVLDGDASLRKRPMERVAEPLRAMGARIETSEGKPPLTITGASLQAIEWNLKVASAQLKSAILLAGLLAQGRTTVREPQLSRDHTERLLTAFGVAIHRNGLAVSVDGGAHLTATELSVPSDPSSAAFLVVAALISSAGDVRIDNVLLNPTRIGFIDVLQRMGADIEIGVTSERPEPVGWIHARSSRLTGTLITPESVPALIDEIPILAVAAACAQGTTTIEGAGELRVKESDRLAAMAEGLRRMNVLIEERPDGLHIEGGRALKGAVVRSFDDHRIAMSLTVAGLVAEGATAIDEVACVAISFPEYFGLIARATQ